MEQYENAQYELQPGVLVNGRYEVVRLIATGGMGSVWLARDTSLDVECALKFIDEEMLASPEARARFPREAKVAAQIRSPHVVDVFEYGTWGGRPYISMEYMEGEELAQRLGRCGMLDLETTYRIVAHVSRALSRAHARGIVHRDLKPENVFLVDGDGGLVAKVLDFGIARHDAYAVSDNATRPGTCLGTPNYMSPEQARGEKIDHRSDLWSLAVIVFQCLVGSLPFTSDSLGALFGQIIYDPILDPTDLAPHLPKALDEWWRKAMQRERDQRFQSAAELSDALAAALGLPPIIVGSQYRSSTPSLHLVPPAASQLLTPTERASDAAVSCSQSSDAAQPPLHRRIKKSWLGVAVAVGLVALALGVGVNMRQSAPAVAPIAPPEDLQRVTEDAVSTAANQAATQHVTSTDDVTVIDADELLQQAREEQDEAAEKGESEPTDEAADEGKTEAEDESAARSEPTEADEKDQAKPAEQGAAAAKAKARRAPVRKRAVRKRPKARGTKSGASPAQSAPDRGFDYGI